MSIRGINRAHIFCSSFAFYDFDPILNERAKEWFDYCVSVSEELGHPLDEGACTPNNTKYVLIRNCKRALEKNADKIEYLELRTSAKEDIGSYGEIEATFVNDYKDGFIGIHRDFVSRDRMLEIGIKLCEIIRPRYGIFYEIPFVYSPYFYASGAMGLGELDVDEWSKFYNPKHVDFRKRVGDWANLTETTYAVCSSGCLREVYPINFINKSHLEHEVFPKTTLENWINAAEHRGKLEQVTGELWAWTIDDADLEDVTVALAQSDICLCVNKENPHRYDYGVRPEDQIKIIPWRERN